MWWLYSILSVEEPVSTLMDVIKTVDRKAKSFRICVKVISFFTRYSKELKIEYASHLNKLNEVIQEKCDLEMNFKIVTDFGSCDVVENVLNKKSLWPFPKAHYEITHRI